MTAPQRWKRLGNLYSPKPIAGWGASYGTYPVPLVLSDGIVRIFFSVRDHENRSHAASIDVEIDGERFASVSEVNGPLLSPGPRGAFDCDGVTIGSVVRHDDRLLAYYLGWTVTRTVPFTNFIGVAILQGSSFQRVFKSPIIGRSEFDPYSVGYPCVIRDETGWRMWYGTHLSWGPSCLEMTHVIREARSADGLHWQPMEEPSIPIEGGEEFAVSRPWVVGTKTGLSMWYARRYERYRLGFAHSDDGESWHRNDDLVLTGLEEDWEEGGQTYPAVFSMNDRTYMLYNGVGYGRTGFGLAVLEK